MKFIHTGDICWGQTPDAGTRWSRERSRDIRETFADIVRRADTDAVDFLFISGNLFAGQPLSTDLRDVNAILASAPRVRAVIIAGERDRITQSSAVRGFSWASNVTFLYPESTAAFEDVRTVVSGSSVAESREGAGPGEASRSGDAAADASAGSRGLPAVTADGMIHILLECGTDPARLPVRPETTGYAYIALGGRRRPEVISENHAAYCGSPEPLTPEDTGDYGVFAGEVSADGALISLEFIPMQKARYIPLVANVTPETSARELEDALGAEIRKKGCDHIYTIRICGKRHPDEHFNFDSLGIRYRILDVEDTSEPQYDMNALFSEHPGDMIGFYIRAMQKPDMSPVEKKALYDGIRALLLSAKQAPAAERSGNHALH